MRFFLRFGSGLYRARDSICEGVSDCRRGLIFCVVSRPIRICWYSWRVRVDIAGGKSTYEWGASRSPMLLSLVKLCSHSNVSQCHDPTRVRTDRLPHQTRPRTLPARTPHQAGPPTRLARLVSYSSAISRIYILVHEPSYRRFVLFVPFLLVYHIRLLFLL
jgi:hypothetical protein